MAGMGAVYASCKVKGKTISGKIVGQNASAGHYFRDKKLAPATEHKEHEIVIIGGGISGLSAARALTMAQKKDIVLLEMDSGYGGNSKWGENEISQYPFGAHYLPIPNVHQQEALDFLHASNIITGFENSLPTYNELHICHDPEDRLYINNYWQEGVVPDHGLNANERNQIARFLKQMAMFKTMRGDDGKYMFDIPISRSSTDKALRGLDGQTFAEWLNENKYDSASLKSYLNYAMVDDFGTTIDDISAWIGIHYFAARKGQANNAKESDVLTWPGGNGFLAQKLLEQSTFTGMKCAMVYAVEEKEDGVYLSYFDTNSHQTFGIKAKQVIAALPAFIFQRILGNHQLAQLPYSPWMIANLKVKNNLVERRGAWMSWDNVIFNGAGLGYINNNHQLLNRVHPVLNLTYYLPFAKGDINANRQKLLNTSYEDWVKMIIEDLSIVHPNIEECLEAVDIQLWGHAMIQPKAGWVFGEHRQKLAATGSQRIHHAHTDYAGMSIFEEAFYQGWNAAQAVTKNIATNGQTV